MQRPVIYPVIAFHFVSDFGIGYRQMFHPGNLTLGTVFAIEAYDGDMPTMKNQVELAKRAEELGFSALWFRDVPLRDPNFGDVGQIYDPWAYLGHIAAHTKTISLATGAIIFPLRHPIDLAKAAASVDQLSSGRLVLGIAAGDRPIEYPAYGRNYEDREMLFQAAIRDFRKLYEDFPRYESVFGVMNGGDLIPKPFSGKIPLFVTGHSGQSLEWIAENADGWLMYPRDPSLQKRVVDGWKSALKLTGSGFKPFSQSLYIDLTDDPDHLPQSIHLGYRLGRNYLLKHLKTLQGIGVNHVFLNLKYGKRPAYKVLEEVGRFVVPHFPNLK
jgi:luciferase-type oxidoreductase